MNVFSYCRIVLVLHYYINILVYELIYQYINRLVYSYVNILNIHTLYHHTVTSLHYYIIILLHSSIVITLYFYIVLSLHQPGQGGGLPTPSPPHQPEGGDTPRSRRIRAFGVGGVYRRRRHIRFREVHPPELLWDIGFPRHAWSGPRHCPGCLKWVPGI